jgi:hypothetical protein
VYNNLACCLEALGEPQEALVLLNRAQETFIKELGHEHPRTFTVSGNITRTERKTQRDFHEIKIRPLRPTQVPAIFQPMVASLEPKKKAKKAEDGKGKGKGKGKKK